ncbi:MAG TPA: ABC transporter permease [Terriglobales bacterium]|nr:ABC transporter permease [Terriglobales bacterium]
MTLFTDLRHALRRLRHATAFTATAVLTLALGMGATTVVYSVMQAVLINSLPFPHAEQIYVLREAGPHGDFSIAWPNFVDWRSQQHSFEDLAAFNQQHFEYFDGVRSTLPRAGMVTAAFFPLLRGQALLGRTFTEAEDKPGAPPVIVLSYAFWQHQLHGDPSALGRTLDLSGKPYTVIGVMPARFAFFLSSPVDFYLPLGQRASNPAFNSRTGHGSISAIGRLKPGVKPETARAEIEAIAARLAAAYPATNGGHSVAMSNFVKNYFSGILPVLELLMAAVVIVLLVGCANVSNLLLTRGADREREFAIRRALGASRRRIVQQSFAESFWLAALATAAGVLIAYVSLPGLLRFAPQIPRQNETAISGPVLAVALGITAVVCLLCGFFPAWNTMRSAPELALRSYSPATSAGRQRQMLRSSLLIAGVAVTVILGTGTGLLVRSLRNTLAADPGFTPDHLLNLDIVLTGQKYNQP